MQSEQQQQTLGFSGFKLETDATGIYLVGYKGAENVRIDVANLIPTLPTPTPTPYFYATGNSGGVVSSATVVTDMFVPADQMVDGGVYDVTVSAVASTKSAGTDLELTYGGSIGDTTLTIDTAGTGRAHPSSYSFPYVHTSGDFTAVCIADGDGSSGVEVNISNITLEYKPEAKNRAIIKLGAFTGTSGEHEYVNGLALENLSQHATFKSGGTYEGRAIDNLEAGMVFRGMTHGTSMTIALNPSNNNVFEFFYNPADKAEFIEDFENPNGFYLESE